MSDTTPDQPFLRAIAAAPDDDAPRLVYADWLDESGRPEWAELIRVQCEAERLRADRPWSRATARHAARLHAREMALLDVLQGQVEAFRPSLPGVGDFNLVRGVVHHVYLPAAAWLAHHAAILAAHPTVRAVTLTAWPELEATAPAEPSGPAPVVCIRGGRYCRVMPAFVWTPEASIRRLLMHEWPGIAFTLPEPGRGIPVPREFDANIDRLRRLNDLGPVLMEPRHIVMTRTE